MICNRHVDEVSWWNSTFYKFNPNHSGRGRNVSPRERPKHPSLIKISWNLVALPKIYLWLIFRIFYLFFKIRTSFRSATTFSQPGVIFLVNVFCWNNEYILGNLNPEGLAKTYTDFSNNTFSKNTIFINLGNYIWRIWFIQKLFLTSMQWPYWNMMTSSKSQVTMISILIVFKRYYAVSHPRKAP